MYQTNVESKINKKQLKCSAIVLAAGQGKRMNTGVQKQYLLLDGKPLIYYSLKIFEESLIVDEVILVTGKEEIEYCQEKIIKCFDFKKVSAVVAGGDERYHSVYQGIKSVSQADYVLIHDGARPFVTTEIIERVFDGVSSDEACVAAVPAKDTVKIAGSDNFAINTPARDSVWLMQTPQAFSYQLIKYAYKELMAKEKSGQPITVTDDAMVVETICGKKVKLVNGTYENIKITTPSDMLIAQAFIKGFKR